MNHAVLIFFAPLVLCMGCWFPRSSSFYVERADLQEPGIYTAAEIQHSLTAPDSDGTEYIPVRGHRIAPGTARIIAYRWWSPGNPLIIDDEHFEKISIRLPRSTGPASGAFAIGDPGVVVTYTDGGSAWPRSACFGEATRGSVRYRSLGGHLLKVTLEAEGELHGMSSRAQCGSFNISRTLNAKSRNVNTLTPWDGRPGTHIYDETYP